MQHAWRFIHIRYRDETGVYRARFWMNGVKTSAILGQSLEISPGLFWNWDQTLSIDKIASSTKSPRNDPAQGVILKESEESGDPSQSAQDDNVMTDNDVWILDELDKTTNKVTKNLENLELHLAVEEIYDFVWHKFADKYIEESKSQRVKAQPTLEYVLKQILILLHPFMPFLTEELYQKFETKRVSIMQESWPSAK